MASSIEAKCFTLLFKGKNNTYVKNKLPKTKPEPGKKIKTTITNNEGKVDADLLMHHLDGDFGVGICPVSTDGRCFFGVLDIDYYKPKIRKVLKFIRDFELPLMPFRSKSGGLHLYLMLSKSVTARAMRTALNEIAEDLSLEEMFGKGKVEIFPKQEKAEGFGSSVTLPYFNCENPYTYLLDLEGNPVPFKEAMTYIKMHLTSLEAVKESLSNLPYNDAPPCIQKLLISGEVGGEDTGRNNFLFSFALYASKKYGDNFESYVTELNSTFEAPVTDDEVNNIVKSIKEHEYSYKCKDIPCCGYCNKNECRKREFGLGRDKGHFADIDYGPLFRYLAADPYYIWKLKRKDQEDYKDIVFKDEGAILDQKNFAKLCVRYLNFAPRQVAQNDWFMTINKALASIKNVEVKQESDTSGLSVIRNAFVKYLANKQSHRNAPFQIHTGLCVKQEAEENGKPVTKYYFKHEGFEEYLRNKKIVFDMQMLGENLRSFGAKNDTLTYTNSLGEEKKVDCWSKEEDKEIESMYEGFKEIEDNDKALSIAGAVSEVSNVAEEETGKEEDRLYTEEDKKNAADLF